MSQRIFNSKCHPAAPRQGDVCTTGQCRRQITLFYSTSHINQMLPEIIHILRFCLADSLPKIL